MYMEADTKPIVKNCSKCCESKEIDKFIPNKNRCKECRNSNVRDHYKSWEPTVPQRDCNTCKETKPTTDFIQSRNICKTCNNERRRTKYQNNEELRLKLIKTASEFKHNKAVERRKIKTAELGEGNKKCSWCDEIKPNDRFRSKRLKCKDCERDDPLEKFKRNIRTRIFNSLIRKEKHTIEYLGCNYEEYVQWIINHNYTLENHGAEWHIDHVIPLSMFNLDNEEEQAFAFNWRNTTPLPVKENLSKNNKILKPQIEQHLTKLLEYHKKCNIDMPEKFIDLFAKYLVAGTPLEPSLPLTLGNIGEELG